MDDDGAGWHKGAMKVEIPKVTSEAYLVDEPHLLRQSG